LTISSIAGWAKEPCKRSGSVLARVFYETEGHRFESCRALQKSESGSPSRDTAWAMSEENVELVPPAYSGGDT
jgi:hypothetical protein